MIGTTVMSRPPLLRVFIKICAGTVLAFATVLVLLNVALAEDRERQHNRDTKNFRIAVFGDSLGDGMYNGLSQITSRLKHVKVKRYSRANTGISRRDRYDWNKAARKLSRRPMDAALLVFGANDMQTIRDGRRRYHFRQKGWEKRYRKRVARIVRNFRKRGVPTYVVGLPIARHSKTRKGYAYLNSIFRSVAEAQGATFIDTWNRFADAKGAFTPYGTLKGRRTKTRAKDGIHFTIKGYQMYARHAYKVVQRKHGL